MGPRESEVGGQMTDDGGQQGQKEKAESWILTPRFELDEVGEEFSQLMFRLVRAVTVGYNDFQGLLSHQAPPVEDGLQTIALP